MIEKRVSSLCSSKKMFDKHAPFYNQCLQESGYTYQIKFLAQTEKRKPRRKRPRYTEYWYNPPYNAIVATRIGEEFLRLVDKHFPAGSKLHRYFNRKTIKVSYCCTRNIASHIAAHNKKVLREAAEKEEGDKLQMKPCPTKNDPCPLVGKYKGKCRTKGVVYQALIKCGNKTWNYFGQTKNQFHDRWYRHKRSMKFEEEQGTALSAKVHELNKEGKTFQIETKIIKEAQVYKVGDSNCDLCLTEKLCIALNHKAPVKLLTLPKGCELLNIRSEEVSGCNHRIDCRLIGRRKPTQRNS